MSFNWFKHEYKLLKCYQWVIWDKLQYRIWNPHRIFYSNRSSNKEIGLLWFRQSFGERIISDFESLSNFQAKEEEKLFKSVQKQRNWTVLVRTVIWGKYKSDLESPLNFQVKEKKIIEIGQETTKLCFN